MLGLKAENEIWNNTKLVTSSHKEIMSPTLGQSTLTVTIYLSGIWKGKGNTKIYLIYYFWSMFKTTFHNSSKKVFLTSLGSEHSALEHILGIYLPHTVCVLASQISFAWEHPLHHAESPNSHVGLSFYACGHISSVAHEILHLFSLNSSRLVVMRTIPRKQIDRVVDAPG